MGRSLSEVTTCVGAARLSISDSCRVKVWGESTGSGPVLTRLILKFSWTFVWSSSNYQHSTPGPLSLQWEISSWLHHSITRPSRRTAQRAQPCIPCDIMIAMYLSNKQLYQQLNLTYARMDGCPIFSLRPLSWVFLFSGSSLGTCPWRCGARRAAPWARCAGRRASSTSSTATRSATWRRWSSPRPRPAPSPPPPSMPRSAGNKWKYIQQQTYFQPLYLNNI